MADLGSLKVPELKKLLQDRSLPVSGNKSELIARIQQHDSTAAASTATAAASTGSVAPGAAPALGEDEIDWDDEDGDKTNAKAAAKPSASASGTAAATAGGQGQAGDPTPDPKQAVDVDAATTADPTVQGGSEAKAAREEASTAPAVAAKDFSAGLAQTDIEKEIAQRKARAQKFGVVESSDAALKALERAKKFGTSAADGELAGGGLKALDQALSSGPRKRGRERDGQVVEPDRQSKRRTPDRNARVGKPGQRNGGGAARGKITDDPVEKAKAEARAKKFGA